MTDDEGALAQSGSGNHRADFLGAKLRVVVRPPVAVAHAGQINRRDAKVVGEVRRNVAPPVAMCAAPVNEQKAAPGRPRRLARPKQVMDPAALYHHGPRLAGVGNGPPKPIRRRRTDRKEIEWYGFATQGGCTRITGSALPLSGQHYTGRRTLPIPEPSVNSSISRSAVPSARRLQSNLVAMAPDGRKNHA